MQQYKCIISNRAMQLNEERKVTQIHHRGSYTYDASCTSQWLQNTSHQHQYNSDLNHSPLCTTQTQPHSHSFLTLTHQYTLKQLRKLLAHWPSSSILFTTLVDLVGM